MNNEANPGKEEYRNLRNMKSNTGIGHLKIS
jgi:hypothetical protein